MTHQGCKSDGMHRSCFLEWVAHNPTCPYDRQQIDVRTLPLTDRIVVKLEQMQPILTEAAYTACMGASTAALGLLGTEKKGRNNKNGVCIYSNLRISCWSRFSRDCTF